jgi:hypothetical protein
MSLGREEVAVAWRPGEGVSSSLEYHLTPLLSLIESRSYRVGGPTHAVLSLASFGGEQLLVILTSIPSIVG